MHVLFMTEEGYFGIGLAGLRRTDIIVIFDGGKRPFVLREECRTDGTAQGYQRGCYSLVGDCIHNGRWRANTLPTVSLTKIAEMKSDTDDLDWEDEPWEEVTVPTVSF